MVNGTLDLCRTRGSGVRGGQHVSIQFKLRLNDSGGRRDAHSGKENERNIHIRTTIFLTLTSKSKLERVRHGC